MKKWYPVFNILLYILVLAKCTKNRTYRGKKFTGLFTISFGIEVLTLRGIKKKPAKIRPPPGGGYKIELGV